VLYYLHETNPVGAAAPQLAELHRLGLALAQEEAERALREDMRLGGYNYNCVPPSVHAA
jgi:hypothetical protein